MRSWHRVITAVACALCAAACQRAGPDESGPPSVLLVVLDTTRRDAVSVYGEVEGTTPYLDSLAREGLRYDWALAPSPWTLPSHATLFTSLGPERHGVGVGGRMVLGSGFTTLAEVFSRAGYQTVGFSENPLVVSELGLAKGFDHFGGEMDANRLRAQVREDVKDDVRFDVELGVQGWAAKRDPERPFFVFVNLFDPHDPYEARESNPFLPESVELRTAARLGRGRKKSQGVAEFAGICSRLPPPDELEILRALYLDELRAADAKLGAVHRRLLEAAGGRLISVVTADHGEHLGEHRLLGHEFSLHGELLRVPLVVHGLPDTPPAVIGTPVGLGDIAPSLVRWAGIEAPGSFTGVELPRQPDGSAPERPWRAAYSDDPHVAPEGARAAGRIGAKRRGCEPGDRVFGEMLSLLRFPHKLIWYEQAPPQLYDLRWDEREISDLAAQQPERVAELSRELQEWRQQLARIEDAPDTAPSPETVEALRSLGYVE